MPTAVHRIPHVLMVEDNPDDVKLLQLAFAPHHKQIDLHWAPNTISAMDFLAHRGRYSHAPVPDLVLVDLNLPVFSGHNLMQEMGKDAAWKRIPIVVLSSSNRQQDISEAYRHGAMLYVVKPSHWERWSDMAGALVKLASVQPGLAAEPRQATLLTSDP